MWLIYFLKRFMQFFIKTSTFELETVFFQETRNSNPDLIFRIYLGRLCD